MDKQTKRKRKKKKKRVVTYKNKDTQRYSKLNSSIHPSLNWVVHLRDIVFQMLVIRHHDLI